MKVIPSISTNVDPYGIADPSGVSLPGSRPGDRYPDTGRPARRETHRPRHEETEGRLDAAGTTPRTRDGAGAGPAWSSS